MPRQRHFGWKMSQPDFRDFLYAPPPEVMRAMPAAVDLTAPPPGAPFDPVYDQSSLGSCGPNSAAGKIVFAGLKAGGAVMPSRLFIYYATRQIQNTTGYDSGVTNRDMLKALNKLGWCPEEMWPYEIAKFTTRPPQECWDEAAKHRIDKYLSVPQNLTALKGCLAEGYPWLLGFSVYSSMLTDEVERTGDIPLPNVLGEDLEGGHDVVAVGYDDATQKFKIRSSWGTDWGKGGYGTIPYAYCLSSKLSGDFWTIRTAAWSPPPAEARIVLTQRLEAGTYRLSPQGTLVASPMREGGAG